MTHTLSYIYPQNHTMVWSSLLSHFAGEDTEVKWVIAPRCRSPNPGVPTPVLYSHALSRAPSALAMVLHLPAVKATQLP